MSRRKTLVTCLFTILGIAFCLSPPGALAFVPGQGGLAALNTVTVPLPANIGTFITNQAAAIQLGKALFWDIQAGSDGKQACASCHFHAGSDVRVTNTVNPGSNKIFDLTGPGTTLTAASFPIATDDIIGSQGEKNRTFLGVSGTAKDLAQPASDPLFNVAGVNVRQVTGRNAPSVIDSVFNFRNFWDGRAGNVFNGKDPSGASTQIQVLQADATGALTPVTLNGATTLLSNAATASQSTGPPLSSVEMSAANRTFPDLGKKMLGLKPLAFQTVDPTDSVLGSLVVAGTKGLNTKYKKMIKAAFAPQWWSSTQLANGFTQMEANFSLFWGLSILMYESTLVSGQSPYDQFQGGNLTALTANQQAGGDVYTGAGKCNVCHSGAELTKAAISQAGNNPLSGFFNTGVRPVAEDGGDVQQPGLGKFKTPGLRNVALNGPYFHNGGKATLAQVVDFYNRGGDNPNANTDGNIRALGLTPQNLSDLIDFMMSMTDPRVAAESKPFDHPSLPLPNRAPLPAVGAAGRAVQITPFLGLDPHTP